MEQDIIVNISATELIYFISDGSFTKSDIINKLSLFNESKNFCLMIQILKALLEILSVRIYIII